MPGRHASHEHPAPTPGRPWLALGAGAVALALLAAGIVAASRGGVGDAASAQGTPEASAPACEQHVTVSVAASPAIAPTVRSVLATGSARRALGPCVVVAVTARDSATLASEPVTSVSPEVWVPETSMWAEALDQHEGADVTVDAGSMASSPLVLAATPAAVERLTGTAAPGAVDVLWDQVLAGTTAVAVVDPETTTEGMATLATLQTVLGVAPGQTPSQALAKTFVGLSRAVLPSVADGFARTADPATAPVFATSEQSVLAAAAQGADVVPAYPSQGTSGFDFPVLRLQRAGEPTGTQQAVRVVTAALTSQDAAAAVQKAGFRTAEGALDPAQVRDLTAATGLPETTTAQVPLTLAVSQDALRTWSAVTLDARMLTVIDVSGSMDFDAGNGRTRVELARDAALTALRLYPDSAQIGLWAFSVLENPPEDWVSLVDVGALGDAVGGGTRRDALAVAAQSLPDRVDAGGTGLYDTALAAFRTVRAGYDPSRVNSVVLLTDGKNEDDPVGIDLPTLLQTLRAEFDPAQPIPIITIGMGPDADIETLRQISETTGGKAYQALDPNDIEAVFLDAMIDRRCRPGC